MTICELPTRELHFTLQCTEVLPQCKQTASGNIQFTTLVAINLAMRGIPFVLAYTTHDYEYMADLSETPVFSQDSDARRSPQHFQLLAKVKSEAKAAPLHAKQAYKGDRGLTLSILDPGLGRVGGQGQAPADLHSGEIPRIHCTGDWVGLKARLYGSRKTWPRRVLSPGQSSPQRVVITTTLCRPSSVSEGLQIEVNVTKKAEANII
jgi:hypothetical protein